MAPDVSVVIPTHGRPTHLVRALESVLASATDRRVEVIVVDDNAPGSEDRERTWAALRPFASRADVRCVQHLHSRHGGAARNTGAACSEARWLAFLDDDDAFAPDKLERQLGALEAGGAEFAYTRTLWFRDGEPVGESTFAESGNLAEAVLTGESEFNSSTIVIDAGLFHRAGGFDESLRRNQDLDLYLRVFTTGAPIVCVDAPLTHVHTDSNANQLPYDAYETTRLAFLDRWATALPDEGARRRAEVAIAADLCWNALKQRRAGAALRRYVGHVLRPAFHRALLRRLRGFLRVNGYLPSPPAPQAPAPTPRGPTPPFSVLLSVYAGERAAWLAACLESLRAQTLLADEIVLVQDGPVGEELQAVIDAFRDALPLRVVPLPENRGLGQALQAGLEACRHDVVARMDADDLCVSERFATQLPRFADPGLAVCGAWIREIDPDSGSPLSERRTPVDDLAIRRACMRRNPFNHMTVVFRRSAVLAAGGYRELPWMEDWYLWTRMLARGVRCANVPAVLVEARTGAGMVARRAGPAYVRSEWRMMRERLRLRLTDPASAFAVFLIRAAPRLLPRRLLALAYRASRGA
jgi:glycosyltransferase involved in cell wall biosynthesis